MLQDDPGFSSAAPYVVYYNHELIHPRMTHSYEYIASQANLRSFIMHPSSRHR